VRGREELANGNDGTSAGGVVGGGGGGGSWWVLIPPSLGVERGGRSEPETTMMIHGNGAA
jgi:hypothetical protein